MHRVCLVVGDPNSQEFFVHLLRSCKKLELVGTYSTGQAALRELPKARPDVVLMDIKLPGMSGPQCLAALRKLSPPFRRPVLILTEYSDDRLIFDALHAGADGYLLKRHTDGRKLQSAINEAMAGGGPMSPSVAHRVIAYFQNGQQRYWPMRQCASLTARENEVIRCFSNGLLYKETADVLKISYAAVHKYQHNAFLKLKAANRSEAIRKWWDMGAR